jgi:hypothetical protein
MTNDEWQWGKEKRRVGARKVITLSRWIFAAGLAGRAWEAGMHGVVITIILELL